MIECLDVVAPIVCIASGIAYLIWLAIVCCRFYLVTTWPQEWVNQAPPAASNRDGNAEVNQGANQLAPKPKEIQTATERESAKKNHTEADTSSEQKPMARNERLSLGLQILIFLVGCYVACVYSGQLREMVTQSKLSVESNMITVHAYEVANATKLRGSRIVQSAPKFSPGSDGKFGFRLENIGKWQATRVSVGYNVDVLQQGEVQPLPMPCFSRPGMSDAPNDFDVPIWPTFHELTGDPMDTPNKRDFNDIVIPDALVRGKVDDLLNGKSYLALYGVAIYWNGICLSCDPFCYLFPLRRSSPSFAPESLESDVTWCHDLPSCSRFGKFDSRGCLQEDISDSLGYYPASDEDGPKSESCALEQHLRKRHGFRTSGER